MELDPIEQEFVANVTRYLLGLEEMIREGQRFVDQNTEDIASVEALQAAIDDLEGKRVVIQAEYIGPGDMKGIEQAAIAAERFQQLSDAEREAMTQGQEFQATLGRYGPELQSVAQDAQELRDHLSELYSIFESDAAVAAQAAEAWNPVRESMASVIGATEEVSTVTERVIAVTRDGTAQVIPFTGAMHAAAQAAMNQASAQGVLSAQGAAANTVLAAQVLRQVAAAQAANTAAGAVGRAAQAANNLRVAQNAVNAAIAGQNANALVQVWALNGVATAMQRAGNNTAAAGAAAGRTYRIWGTGIRVTGNAIHWLISGTLEILAVLIPALIAAGGAMMTMAEGATWVKDRMTAVYTATEATSSMLGVTAGQAVGLSGALQKAQTAADPKVYELLGAGINALRPSINGTKSAFAGFWQEVSPVTDALDRFAAEMVINMHSAFGGTMHGLIAHMSMDLVALGQVFGNLGHSIAILAASMPGLAEVLLGIIAGITKGIEAVVNFASHISFLGLNVLTLGLGLEELSRWGGLLLRVLGNLIRIIGGAVSAFGLARVAAGGIGPAMAMAGAETEAVGISMAAAGASAKGLVGSLRMLFFTPWGRMLLGIAAFALLMYELSKVKDATDQLTSSMENALSKMTLAAGLASAIQDLKILDQQAAHTTTTVMQAGTAFRYTGAAVRAANPDYQTLVNTQSDLAAKIASVLSIQTKWGTQNYSLIESIGLASAAGVQMNQMLDKNGHLSGVASQQILDLVAGYQAMAQTGGTLNADIQAVNVSALQQQTQVQKLNQAWDTFMQNLTGGTNAFATLNSDMTTLGNVTITATSKIQAFSQGAQGTRLTVDQIARSLRSFSGQSAQTWQNYNAAVMQAQQVTDWLRTAAASGAITMGTTYNNAIKGVVAMLLPFAKYSQTAAAELSGIAFQVTGTSMSYKQLVQWVGNTKTAQKDLNQVIQDATKYMSNLNAIAANLSTTLATTVDTAIAQGAVNTTGLMNATQKLTGSIRQTGIYSMTTSDALYRWVQQLYNANVGANNARSVIYQLAQNMHLSRDATKLLADEVYNLYQQMSKIHDVTARVSVQTIYSSTGTPTVITTGAGVPTVYGGGGGHRVGYATGGRVPGSGSGDRVPAMLEPGEAVVPKHLVGAVAPFLGSHGVPGFARGGWIDAGHPIMRPGAFHRAPTPMELVIAQWAKELWRMDLHKYGPRGPVGLTELEHMFKATQPGSGRAWNNPQYRLMEAEQRADMAGYYAKDVNFWKLQTEKQTLMRSEQRQLTRLEKLLHHAELTHNIRLIDQYRRDMSNVRIRDMNEMRNITQAMELLFHGMGYGRSARVRVGHYDRGGYLPEGLSLALNTTGRPEPVGHQGGPSVIHVHLEMSGREVANAMVPYMVGSVNRYGIRNSGKATGILRPS